MKKLKKTILWFFSFITALGLFVPLAKANESITEYDPKSLSEKVFEQYLYHEFDHIRIGEYFLPQGIEEVRKILGECLKKKRTLHVWRYSRERASCYKSKNPYNRPVYYYYC